jgi:DNA-nicking Smr family endonuclease
MGKRDRELEDDAALWARIAKTAAPLKTARAAPKAAPAKPREKSLPKAAEPERKPAPKPVARPRHAAAREAALDRQTVRKLESGRLPVEARLDLHGMKQKDAHAALKRFLKGSQAEGHRHVLVITGKGAAAPERKSFYAEEGRGVLRQAVPHWLAAPDLAPLVVSFSAAPRRLGGDGALYVRLRKFSGKSSSRRN